MMGGIPPPPKNSLARIFTPPRKRRRVRQSAISLIPASDFHSRSLLPFLPPLPFLRRQESLRRSRIRRQATIAMFRFAENSRCCENEIPAYAGMEGGGKGFFEGWRTLRGWGNKFPRKFRTIINYGARYYALSVGTGGSSLWNFSNTSFACGIWMKKLTT